ncbi:hypothetical protein HYR54_17705 [Candidatus Acetothermia bacterium]|nr:hypothetical protein [Candidatus Acetothermia bacterium]
METRSQTQTRARTIIFVSLALLLAMAVAVFWGIRHPSAMTVPMSPLLPSITLGTVIVAGAVDGINPCAFTVLLLFVTALLAGLQAKSTRASPRIRRLCGPD